MIKHEQSWKPMLKTNSPSLRTSNMLCCSCARPCQKAGRKFSLDSAFLSTYTTPVLIFNFKCLHMNQLCISSAYEEKLTSSVSIGSKSMRLSKNPSRYIRSITRICTLDTTPRLLPRHAILSEIAKQKDIVKV
ncbi:hypothetical protein Q3G72_021247 [Acer saccharum]|nr:hypothetical protein Q3G72_021247 [Acer saccharum]